MERLKKIGKNLLAGFVGLLVAFFILEIFLRIYNPFPSRIRGNKIFLEKNLSQTVIIDPPRSGLDTEITHSTNSIGFRGEDPPSDWDSKFTILTIGGSTTECSLIDDGKTWTALLGKKLEEMNPGRYWINNAGIDGCSSFGHVILMEDYVIDLKPDMVLFLVGINDVARSNFDHEDGFLIDKGADRQEGFIKKLMNKSEVIVTVRNLIRASQSRKAKVAHGDEKDMVSIDPDSSVIREHFESGKKALPAYRERIQKLITLCKDNDIEPVFVTQPIFHRESYYHATVLSWYNDAVREICAEKGLFVVNLDKKLAKTAENYYDGIHYTNLGQEEVASDIFEDLAPYLKSKNP